MQNTKLKNIDDVMKASDIVKLLEQKKDMAENKVKEMLRSDGIPKKGMALSVMGLSNSIEAARLVTIWLEVELEKINKG